MFTVCITMCTCAIVLQYSCNGRDRTDIDCYQKNSTAIVVLHTKSKMFPSANVEKQLISMLVVEQFTLHCLAKCVLQLGTYGQCALLRFIALSLFCADSELQNWKHHTAIVIILKKQQNSEYFQPPKNSAHSFVSKERRDGLSYMLGIILGKKNA